jgi:hypothetical protein
MLNILGCGWVSYLQTELITCLSGWQNDLSHGIGVLHYFHPLYGCRVLNGLWVRSNMLNILGCGWVSHLEPELMTCLSGRQYDLSHGIGVRHYLHPLYDCRQGGWRTLSTYSYGEITRFRGRLGHNMKLRPTLRGFVCVHVQKLDDSR